MSQFQDSDIPGALSVPVPRARPQTELDTDACWKKSLLMRRKDNGTLRILTKDCANRKCAIHGEWVVWDLLVRMGNMSGLSEPWIWLIEAEGGASESASQQVRAKGTTGLAAKLQDGRYVLMTTGKVYAAAQLVPMGDVVPLLMSDRVRRLDKLNWRFGTRDEPTYTLLAASGDYALIAGLQTEIHSRWYASRKTSTERPSLGFCRAVVRDYLGEATDHLVVDGDE